MFGAFIYTDEQIKKSTYAGFYTKIENFKFICTGWGHCSFLERVLILNASDVRNDHIYNMSACVDRIIMS